MGIVYGLEYVRNEPTIGSDRRALNMNRLLSRMKSLYPVLLGFCLAAGLGCTPAFADMLPFVVDYTRNEQPVYWWSSARPQLQSTIDQTLFSDEGNGIVRPQQKKDFSVSRIFQRAELSVLNAQQIAQLVGATTFFLGRAQADSTEVTWLDSTAAIVTIHGDLYDTRSGSLLGSIEVVGRGVSSTHDGAIRLASHAAAQDLRHFQPSSAVAKSTDTDLQVVVHAHDKAQTFLTLSEHFSRAMQNRGEIHPCRASEGEVSLCVRSEEDEQLLRGVLLQGLQRELEDLVVDDIQEEDHRIHIYAHTPSDDRQPSENARPLL